MDWIFSLTLLFCSRFWFLKICHRDFCQTYWEIFENWDIMKIDHFLGHFSTRYIQIWQKKKLSWLLAWTNEKNVHLRFLIFENLSQRYLSNIVRDFWKLRNNENWPFSRPYFYQIQLDMAKNIYVLTIRMDKWKTCTSQIFPFWNFITEIFV